MSKAVVNILCASVCWTDVCISLGVYLKRDFWALQVSVRLSLYESVQLFPRACTCWVRPHPVHEGPPPTPPSALVAVRLAAAAVRRCAVASAVLSVCISLMNDVGYFFNILINYLYTFSCEATVQTFCSFF